MNSKITLENITKVFCQNPALALKSIDTGKTKEQVFKETGATIAVQNVNLEIKPGEIFVVMGLSGSGKSTLIRIINRLIEPTAGKVTINGEDVTSMDKKKLTQLRRHTVGMVFQSFALMTHLNVFKNVALGLDISGLKGSEKSKRVLESLEQVGLREYVNSYPRELSGGMQQRVGLARALAQDPEILLMDEAFSALDPIIRSEMQDEFLKLQEKKKRTIVFISHDLHEAMKLGDRVAIMQGGCIVQVGTPDQILKNPADNYVKSFFKDVDPTTVFLASDIASKTLFPQFFETHDLKSIAKDLKKHDCNYGIITDEKEVFLGLVSKSSIEAKHHEQDGDISSQFINHIQPVRGKTILREMLPVLTYKIEPIPIIDENGKYLGVVTKSTFLETCLSGVPNEVG